MENKVLGSLNHKRNGVSRGKAEGSVSLGGPMGDLEKGGEQRRWVVKRKAQKN